MRVGNYVRFRDEVGQIIKEEGDELLIRANGDREVSLGVRDEDVLCNEQLINLVEEGDYINGFPVVEISTFKTLDGNEQRYLRVNRFEYLVAIYDKDIETMMTGDFFERNVFHAKEEEEECST